MVRFWNKKKRRAVLGILLCFRSEQQNGRPRPKNRSLFREDHVVNYSVLKTILFFFLWKKYLLVVISSVIFSFLNNRRKRPNSSTERLLLLEQQKEKKRFFFSFGVLLLEVVFAAALLLPAVLVFAAALRFQKNKKKTRAVLQLLEHQRRTVLQVAVLGVLREANSRAVLQRTPERFFSPQKMVCFRKEELQKRLSVFQEKNPCVSEKNRSGRMFFLFGVLLLEWKFHKLSSSSSSSTIKNK